MTGLIIFDVEGVLIPKRWALILEIVRRRSSLKLLVMLLFAALYQIKILRLKNFITRSYRLLKGVDIKTFYLTYSMMPISRNSETVFMILRDLGYSMVLMSSGLPQEIVDDLKQRLGADQAYGIDVKKDGQGLLTGEIGGTVIEKNGKLKLLLETVKKIGPRHVSVIADDWNNLQMQKDCDLFIGFNPDPMVAAKTMTVVEGNDLLPVLKILQGQPLDNKMINSDVLIRKSIHFLGVFTLITTAYLGLATTQMLIGVVLALYMLSERLRLSGSDLPFFTSITRIASKEVEQTSVVTTPVWYALGILLTISLFPFRYAVIGVVTLTVGDPIASIIGHLSNGSNHYSFNKAKSFNGSLAGSIAALTVCLLVAGPSYTLLGCLAGMLVETLPLPLNDNITIPLSASFASLIVDKILLLN